MKKIISMLLAIITVMSLFCLPAIAATKNDVPTSYNQNILYKWETPSMEKYTIRLYADKDSVWRVSGKVNGTGVLWCSNAKKDFGNELTVSALGEGTAYVYVALYKTNSATGAQEVQRLLIYKFVAKKQNGKMRFVNAIDDVCPIGDSIRIGNGYTSVARDSFVKAQRTLQTSNGVTVEKISDGSKVSFTNANNTLNKYGFRSNTLPEEKHVHVYENNVCKMCGHKRDTYVNGFPSEFYSTCPEQGEVKDVKSYTDKNGKTISFSAIQIYLPYGYDASKQYNVVFLVHGKGGNRKNWISSSWSMQVPGHSSIGKMSGKNLFDWLIYTGEAAPFIAVSVDLDHYTNDKGDVVYNDGALVKKIRQYYLPCIINTYSTYAKSDNEADIERAKDHFAFCGASRGAVTVYKVAVDPTQPIAKMFGHEMFMSGDANAKSLQNLFGTSTNTLYFANGGSQDSHCWKAMKSYPSYFPQFMYIEYDSGHSWYTWLRGFAAAMQLAMK